jgi:HlyD family secretion protein
MTKTYKRLAAWVVLAAAVLFAGWLAFARTATSTEAEVQVLTRRQTVSHGVSLVGRVEPAESVTLTAPFDGEILQRRYEEGQYVHKGQVLVELSSSEMEVRLREVLAEKLRTQATLQKLRDWKSGAELSRANRSLANATHNVEELNIRHRETEILYKKGIVAKMEVDGLVQQLRSARSEAIAAQEEVDFLAGPEHKRQLRLAMLEEANANDKYTALLNTMRSRVLVAPFSGVVLKAAGGGPEAQGDLARPGARVAKGALLLGLASKDKVRIGAMVDEGEVRQLKSGQRVEITGETFGGEVVIGAIEAISSVPTQASSGGSPRYDIKVTVPELAPELRAQIRLGMSANLKIITYLNPHAILIPIRAVYSEDGKQFAQVVDSAGGVKRTAVEVISTTDTDAEITGINAGTRVVVGRH